MKKKSQTIVFFGNERLATGVTTNNPVLNTLIKDGYTVAAVVVNHTEAASRKERTLEVKSVTSKNKIPLIYFENTDAIKKQIKDFGAACGVLVAFGKIIPEEIITLFPRGIVNVHPSMLPAHRGPVPLESVILKGDTRTGVSVMQLVKAMDAGPVYIQVEVPLTGSEPKQELADKLGLVGAELVSKVLPDILDSRLKPTLQNDLEATYDTLITKLDGAIDWNLRAESIERQIRAYCDWPGSRAEILGKGVIILEAEVIEITGIPGEVLMHDKKLIVCCGDNAINIIRIKPAGKQAMDAKSFIAGYGKKLH